jgi:hypothetical protein
MDIKRGSRGCNGQQSTRDNKWHRKHHMGADLWTHYVLFVSGRGVRIPFQADLHHVMNELCMHHTMKEINHMTGHESCHSV